VSNPPEMPRPRLLDLFCGAGGAAMGYHRAGFDVVGVDIEPQPHYPFDFVPDDALRTLQGSSLCGLTLRDFDAIHASPPCQWGTAYGRRPNHVKESRNLVPVVRDLLERTGLPYVIEQPWVNRHALISGRTVVLDGTQFGLDVMRRRCFESNVPGWIALERPPRHPELQTPRFPPATNRTNLRRTVEVGVWRIPLDVQKRAMGVDHEITLAELSQAIPPAYTEFIGGQLLAHLAVTHA
jgi:DNA (cytosine-5)-methyltransferase 1